MARGAEPRVSYDSETMTYTLEVEYAGATIKLPVMWGQLNSLGASMVEAMNQGSDVFGTPKQTWVGDPRRG